MRIVIRALGWTLALMMGLASAHAASVLHGVKVEDTAAVAGVNLQLNGFGTRYKGPSRCMSASSTQPRKWRPWKS